MTIQPYYDGAAFLKIDANQGSGLEQLGYSEDGVRIRRELFRLPVHGDQNGGLDGPPIDIQQLGAIYHVEMTLTSFDWAVLTKLENGVAGGTAGTEGTVGTLLFSESNKIFRFLVHTTNRPLNFLRAVVEDLDWNKGTKHNKVLLTMACYKNASNLYYNTTTS